MAALPAGQLRANGDLLLIIARNIGITGKTLCKHVKRELNNSRVRLGAPIGVTVVRMALDCAASVRRQLHPGVGVEGRHDLLGETFHLL